MRLRDNIMLFSKVVGYMKNTQNIKQYLILKKYIPYFLFPFGFSPFPYAITILPTFRCNLKCKMCPLSKGLRNMNELDIDAWKKIIDIICKSFIIKPRVHISGGEPLLYKDIVQLIQYISSKGLKCSMTTNGTLLKKYAREIVNNIDKLNVSVDGLENVHESIRGVPGCYKKTFDSIDTLHTEKMKSNLKYPIITLNCVITEDNHKTLVDFFNEIEHNRSIDSITFQHLIFSEEPPSGINTDILIKQLLNIENNKSIIPVTIYPKIRIKDVKPYYSDLSYEFTNKCLAPFFSLRIDPTGNVSICSPLDKYIRNKNVIAEGSLKTIWNDRYLRMGRQKLKKSLSKECLRCCHREY